MNEDTKQKLLGLFSEMAVVVAKSLTAVFNSQIINKLAIRMRDECNAAPSEITITVNFADRTAAFSYSYFELADDNKGSNQAQKQSPKDLVIKISEEDVVSAHALGVQLDAGEVIEVNDKSTIEEGPKETLPAVQEDRQSDSRRPDQIVKSIETLAEQLSLVQRMILASVYNSRMSEQNFGHRLPEGEELADTKVWLESIHNIIAIIRKKILNEKIAKMLLLFLEEMFIVAARR